MHRHARKRIHNGFSNAKKVHHQKNHAFNPQAGEMLIVMPIILCFAQNIVAKELGRAVVGNALESYEVRRDSAILTKIAKIDDDADPSRLKTLPSLHLRKFAQAYGADMCKFKHHLVQHLHEQCLHLGCLIDGFVCGRKNSEHKGIATIVGNSSPSL